jgi:hypothetical protein
VANVKERLTIDNQISHRFHIQMFSLQDLNELKGKKQYVFELSNMLATVENLKTNADINVEEDEVGGTCGTNRREEERV